MRVEEHLFQVTSTTVALFAWPAYKVSAYNEIKSDSGFIRLVKLHRNAYLDYNRIWIRIINKKFFWEEWRAKLGAKHNQIW